jgi:hypothetical protein
MSENSHKENKRYWKLNWSGAKISKVIPSRRIHRKKCFNDIHQSIWWTMDEIKNPRRGMLEFDDYMQRTDE